jgi:hypothetical protein
LPQALPPDILRCERGARGCRRLDAMSSAATAGAGRRVSADQGGAAHRSSKSLRRSEDRMERKKK